MFRRFVLAGSLVGLALAGAPLRAQQTSRAPAFEFAPYAGYMLFGDMLKGPLGTSLSNANGMVYGAQLGIALSKNVALVGNVAHSNANLRVGLPILGGISLANSSVWLYDGGLQLSMPLGTTRGLPLTPFAQVGAGALHYTVEKSIVRANASNFAFNAGLGADLALAPNVGLRLMAKDYVGKFDFKEATGLGVGDGKLSHNIALSAGVKVAF